MATALHIYANLLWRAQASEAQIKRLAALRLLTEPHYRLQLEELAKALASSRGFNISSEFLQLAHLADVFAADPCFSYSEMTGNVLVDAAALLGAGKACLKEMIDRTWDTSSPLSWARNQLAWYIVSRQHMDMRASDLFLAPVDEAESFLVAAWSSRMELRDHSGQPYDSLDQLLAGDPCLELTHDLRAVKLAFSLLVQLQNQHQPQQQPKDIQGQDAGAMPAAAAAGESNGAGEGGASGAGGSMAALLTSLQRTHLTPRAHVAAAAASAASAASASAASLVAEERAPAPPSGGHLLSNGSGGDGSGHEGEGLFVVDEVYENGDGAEEDGDDDDGGGGELREVAACGTPVGSSAAGAGAGSRSTGSYTGGSTAATHIADGDGDGGAASRGQPWPLRPDLLHQYIRAVFQGSSSDQLLGVVALALVEAGRSGGPGGHRSWHQPQGATGGINQFEPLRFRLPLSRLLTHVRDTAPHLIPAAAGAGPGGGGGWHVGALMQRLRERHSRGCFRVLMQGGGEGPAEEGREAGGADDGEEAVAVLDLEALRGRVVEALVAYCDDVFGGSRIVDIIRRAAAAHLASRTRSFVGRAHCVRLSTLARQLGEDLPEHFDPNRLAGLARMVGAESSSNVMHVFQRAPPGSQGPGAGWGSETTWSRGGGGEGMATFVTLNVGKLLSAAGLRELEGFAVAAAAWGRSAGAVARVGGAGGREHVEVRGSGAGGGAGRGAADSPAAAAAAAATRAVSAATQQQQQLGRGTRLPSGPGEGYLGAGSSRLTPSSSSSYPSAPTAPHPHPSTARPAQPAATYNAGAADAAASAAASHHSAVPPPPPSEAALSQAVGVLFPPGGSGAGPAHPDAEVVAAAAKRVVALSLVTALHSQPGGLLPLGRLVDIVQEHAPSAPSLELLLATEPDLFEFQEHWAGGPRGVRLRSAAVMARASRAAPSTTHTGAGTALPASGSGYHPAAHSPQPAVAAAAGSDSLPERPGSANCSYYMRHGTCGYGAACRYNHPPPMPRHPAAESSAVTAAAAAAAAAALAAAAAGPPNAAAAASQRSPMKTSYPTHIQQQQQHPQPQPNHVVHHVVHPSPVPTAAAHACEAPPPPPSAAPAMAATPAPPPVSADGGSLSPLTLEVKVVTTACTPDHLDMLQHCFAAGHLAVACKAQQQHHNHHNHQGAELSPPSLVQLFAPSVAASGGKAAAGSGTTHGSAGPNVGSDAGGSGGGGPAPRWPATVYLVDPAAAKGDKGALLLASLSPLLEEAAVSKVVYNGAEVVPYLARGCSTSRITSLHDVSVLHAMVTAAAAAAAAAGGDGSAPAPAPLPSLAAMLLQQNVMTAAGAATVAAAPSHSQLWAARPLGPELRQQAVLEVVHLAALWSGLMTRLAALPQQLSQAAADRLVREQTAAAAAASSTAAPSSSGMRAPAPPPARLR